MVRFQSLDLKLQWSQRFRNPTFFADKENGDKLFLFFFSENVSFNISFIKNDSQNRSNSDKSLRLSNRAKSPCKTNASLPSIDRRDNVTRVDVLISVC